jgi:hypothetical protein
MKKIRFKSLNFRVLTGCIALLCIAVIINSCRKDNSNATITNPVVNAAKAWYESAYPTNITTGKALNLNKNTSIANYNAGGMANHFDYTRHIKPDWNHADTYARLGKDVVELPLDPSSDNIAADFKAGNGVIYKHQYSRSSFILLKDARGYQAYVMTIIADSAYIGNDLSKLAKTTYRKRDPAFTGIVLYFTPTGTFVRSYGYKNGVLMPPKASVASTTMPSPAGAQVKSLSHAPLGAKTLASGDNCTLYFLTLYCNGVPFCTQFLFEVCCDQEVVQAPSPSGGGGGGDGTSPIPQCPPGTTSTTDPSSCPSPTLLDQCGLATPCLPPCMILVDTVNTPCGQKIQLNATAADPTVAAQNKQLFNDVKTSNLEHGFIQNLVNPTIGSSYYTTPELIATSTLPDQLTPSFYWDNTNGYTIGVTHDHPDGSAPSPADIFYMLINSQSSTLTAAGPQAVAFYKANASVTVVTNTNNYVVTVNDWGALQTLYNTYIANKTAFNNNVISTSKADNSYEAAILSIFGSAINLYTDGGTTSYYPLTLDTTGITPTSVERPCP